MTPRIPRPTSSIADFLGMALVVALLTVGVLVAVAIGSAAGVALSDLAIVVRYMGRALWAIS